MIKKNAETIKELLIRHEGLERKIYFCTEGYPTIGVGRNLETNGITEDEALYLLDNDIKICVSDLRNIFDLTKFSIVSQPINVYRVLVSMRFQLGAEGFRRFKKFIQAIKDNNIPRAQAEMINSRWYAQTPNRVNELIAMLGESIDEDATKR